MRRLRTVLGLDTPEPVRSGFLLSLGRGKGITWKDVAKHVLVLGGTGSGKTFSTHPLRYELVRDSAALIPLIKPDDAKQYLAMNLGSRLLQVRPGSGHSINAAQEVVQAYGVEGLGDVLGKLSRAAMTPDTSGRSEEYWEILFQEGVLNTAALIQCAGFEVSFDLLRQVLASTPATLRQVARKRWDQLGAFGRILSETKDCPKELRPGLERACAFHLSHLPGLGQKGRGSMLMRNTAVLGRLSTGPFKEAFNTTTLTPQMIDEQKLVVLLDYPILQYGVAARLFNLTWVLLTQQYALRRNAAECNNLIIIRDEAQLALNPEADAECQNVARSQKLILVNLLQDIDTLVSAMGGGDLGRSRAMSWLANHAVKIVFASDSRDTAEFVQSLAGERKELLASFGSGQRGPSEGGDMWDQVLGVGQPSFSMSEQYRPRLPSGTLQRLRVGECLVFVSGRSLGPDGYLKLDLRRW